MDKAEQRIAILKACGWVIMPDGRAFNKTSMLDDDNCVCAAAPDLDHDLMHEAESLLTDSQWCDWFDIIGRVIGYATPVPPADYTERIMIQKATVDQRAETFLRTLGLWIWPLPARV